MNTLRFALRAWPFAAALACVMLVTCPPVSAQSQRGRAPERPAPGAPQTAQAPPAETAPQLFAEIARLRDAGRLAEAQQAAERLVALVSARGEAAWEDQSVAWNTLGQIQYARGNYPAAVRSLSEVVRLRRGQPGSDRVSLAQAVTNLARATEANGDAAGAVPLFSEAVDLFVQARGPSHADVAAATWLLGEARLAAGDSAGAAAAFERVIEVREQTQAGAPAVLEAMRALARAKSRAGREEEAASILTRAVAAAEVNAGPEHPELATTLLALGTLRVDEGRTEEAEPLLRRALAIAEPALGATHPDTASTLAALGRLYQIAGRFDQARPYYERALEARRATLGDRHPDVVSTLERLAVLRALGGDALGAVRDQEEALESAQYLHDLVLRSASAPRRLREAASLAESLEAAVSLHLEHAPSSVAAARLALTSVLRSKGRLVEAATRVDDAVAARLGAEGAGELAALRALQRELAATITGGRSGRSGEAFAADVAALEQRIAEAEAALVRDRLEYRPPAPPVSIDDVQARLSKDTALVEFVVHRPGGGATIRTDGRPAPPRRYVAYILTARGQVSWVDLGEAAVVDEAVAAFRDALRDPRRMDAVSYARRLDVMVFAPVLGKVPQARHLVLAPDGLLDLVPFAALADRRGDYRLTQFLITYVSSGRDLIPRVRREAREPALILAAPALGALEGPVAAPERDAVAPRAGTREEASAVKAVLPDARLLTGAEASREALESAAGPALLHVAAPAFVAPVATGSARPDTDAPTEDVSRVSVDALPFVGLALSGAGGTGSEAGVVTGNEIAALDLDGTSLCALTAMEPGETGTRSADGVFAARRALVVAGCESQLLTLWQVSERVTNEIVPALYQQLRDGAGRAEALRRAQQTLASTPRTQHPHYWAPFVLSGNWRGMRDVFAEPPIR